MKYYKLVSSLVSGSFAVFSSRVNNHVCVCKDVNVYTGSKSLHVQADSDISEYICPGTTIVRQYDCTSSGTFIKAISLDNWKHSQKVQLLKNQAIVTDELKWANCFAKRSYCLRKTDYSPFFHRKDSEWVLQCRKPPLNIPSIKTKFKLKLQQADQDSFRLFTQDDNSHDSKIDEDNLRYFMRILFD